MQFSFEDYVLDTDRHELRRGSAVVPVEPQVFDVLTYLVRHRDRVVSRDDLLAAVWEGRIVSESTLSSRINLARAAVGDNGEDQRLIRTVLRRGFRFVAAVREEQRLGEAAPMATTASEPVAVASFGSLASSVESERPGTRLLLVEAERPGQLVREGTSTAEGVRIATYRPEQARRTNFVRIAGAGMAAAAAAVLLAFFLWPQPQPATQKGVGSTQPIERFDPSVVPLINDAHRRSLASYAGRPDAKALAIAYDVMAAVDAAADVEAAKQAAVQQCQAKTQRVCRVYAAGMDVVWSRATIPLPAWSDLRLETLSVPLVPKDVPLMRGAARRNMEEQYLKWATHKALAITTGGSYYTADRRSRSEAARMAVEGCAEHFQRPCLVLSIDGFLTLEIPKTRKVDRIFLPSIEPEIPRPHRERIAELYQGAQWRALATGKNDAWEAVAGAASEAEAIDAALKACARVDRECRIYAVGNFHVTSE